MGDDHETVCNVLASQGLDSEAVTSEHMMATKATAKEWYLELTFIMQFKVVELVVVVGMQVLWDHLLLVMLCLVQLQGPSTNFGMNSWLEWEAKNQLISL